MKDPDEHADSVLRRRRDSLSPATIVLEITSIIIGVLLALGVNQWNENRKNENQAREVLAHVANELQANKKIIERVHGINEGMLHYLETAAADDDSTVNFVPALQVDDNAWNTLVSTGHSAHVGYRVLLPVSEIYSFQQIYKDVGMQMTQAHMTASMVNAAAGRDLDEDRMTRQMQPYIALMVSLEGHLLESYDKGLEKLSTIGIYPAAP